MRKIHTDIIINQIKDMCIEANIMLASDVDKRIRDSSIEESSAIGKYILGQLVENLEIAKTDFIPICQDTGMAVVFIKIGQEVSIEGENLTDAINEGIRRGYEEGYLRKSVVGDPLLRVNTKDNTPGIIHMEIVPGNQIEITIAPKGFGSENMSRIYMLKPSDGREGVKQAVKETVQLAGPNACPPLVVGVGIGGDFEKAAILAKQALTRDLNQRSLLNHIKELEEELYIELNQLGIGPGAFGGETTVLGINIETYPTHIAGLPVAINICCHVNRHVKRVI